MVAVPTATPVTTPEKIPMLATVGSLLVHEVPPELYNVPVAPTHILVGPPIEAGVPFTVTDLVTLQPVGRV